MDKDYDSFVIHIWYESSSGTNQPADWRGTIDHVGEDKRLYFCELEGMQRFIQEQTGIHLANRVHKFSTRIRRLWNDLVKNRIRRSS